MDFLPVRGFKKKKHFSLGPQKGGPWWTIKGFHRTTQEDVSGALAFLHSVLEHCVCLLQIFLFMRLRNKFHFTVVACTKITRYSIKMNHNISHLKGLQTTIISDGLGALAFTQCTRKLCLPPTAFLFLWLRNEFYFTVVACTKITKYLI